MEEKLVTVVVAVYNVEEHLNSCLDSLILQTYKNFEVLIINDGSLDNSAIIAEKYNKIDSRFELISKENEGLSKTRNFGLDKANGDYIIFIDGDDYLSLDFIERCMNKAKQKNADAVFTSLKFDYISKPYKKKIIFPNTKYKKHPVELINYNSPTIPTKFFRTQFLKDNNLRFIDYLYEDIIFTTQFLINKPIIEVSCEAYYNYVQRPNSIMQRTDSKIIEIEKCFEEILNYANESKVPGINEYLEILVIRNLLLASVRRVSRVKYFKERKRIIKSHLEFIDKNFPKWKKSKYINSKNINVSKIYILILKLQRFKINTYIFCEFMHCLSIFKK
jgi:glycosyltransferase involved in cell wall biosynthesis